MSHSVLRQGSSWGLRLLTLERVTNRQNLKPRRFPVSFRQGDRSLPQSLVAARNMMHQRALTLCHCTRDVQAVQSCPMWRLRMEKPSMPYSRTQRLVPAFTLVEAGTQDCLSKSNRLHRQSHLKYPNTTNRPALRLPHTSPSLSPLHPSLPQGIPGFGIRSHSAQRLQHSTLGCPQGHPLHRRGLMAMAMESQSALEMGIPTLAMYQSCRTRGSGNEASGLPDKLVQERHPSQLNQVPSKIREEDPNRLATLITRSHNSTLREGKDSISISQY